MPTRASKEKSRKRKYELNSFLWLLKASAEREREAGQMKACRCKRVEFGHLLLLIHVAKILTGTMKKCRTVRILSLPYGMHTWSSTIEDNGGLSAARTEAASRFPR